MPDRRTENENDPESHGDFTMDARQNEKQLIIYFAKPEYARLATSHEVRSIETQAVKGY